MSTEVQSVVRSVMYSKYSSVKCCKKCNVSSVL